MTFSTLRYCGYLGLFSTGSALGILAERRGLFPHQDPKLSNLSDSVNESKLNRGKDILKYGFPKQLVESPLFYENHVLEYNSRTKTPSWVAEHINKNHVRPEGMKSNRKFSKFKRDELIPTSVSSTNDDYWDSGWSRGHMAPAGNNKHSQKAMDETFLLTNIVPQDIKNNGDFWNRLEIYCRELTQKYSDVRVISGPLWLPKEAPHELEPLLGNSERRRKKHKLMTYPVIGANHVSVPTHLYKIVLVEDGVKLKEPLLEAFVVPNEPISKEKLLSEFRVPLDKLEKETGWKFHDKLDRNRISSLCTVEGCNMMSYKEFQAYFIHRGLSGAKNERELTRYWNKALHFELDKDVNILQTYQDKRQELDVQNSQKEPEQASSAAAAGG